MDGVLNEVTSTIHKQEPGRAPLRTVCGATNHVSQDGLKRITGTEPGIDTTDVSKCGRCFDEGGGY